MIGPKSSHGSLASKNFFESIRHSDHWGRDALDLIASRNIKTSRQKQIQNAHAEQLFDSIYPTHHEFWHKERERVLIICCALIKTSAIPKKSGNENKKWHGQKSLRLLGFKGKINIQPASSG